MSKKESVPNRQYTEEFKVEAMRLAASIGGNAAAKRIGVPQSTVTNWVRSRKGLAPDAASIAQPMASQTRRPVSDLESENTRLRRELVNAKLDLDIVKKAAAYFAAWAEARSPLLNSGSRDEICLDRGSSRRVQRHPHVRVAGGFAIGILSMAKPCAQRASAFQRGA